MFYKKNIFIFLSIIGIFILSYTIYKNNSYKYKKNIKQEIEVDLSGYKHPEIFITPHKLKSKLGDRNLIILDANKGSVYAKGHIPGAINIGFQKLSNTNNKPGDRGWSTLVNKQTLIKRLESLGIDNKKTVVFYSDVMKTPGADGVYVWQLKMAGMDNVKLLYGGLQKWKDSGYELSKEDVEPNQANGLKLKNYNLSYVADMEYIKENLGKIKIIDVRDKKEYKDNCGLHGEARGGHIKGAIHMYWKELLNKDGTPKFPSEIRKIMKGKAGIDEKDEFVVYSTMGIESGYITILLRAVGFDKARNYEASIYEWAAIESLPMESK